MQGVKCQVSELERRVAAPAALRGRVAGAATCGAERHSTAVTERPRSCDGRRGTSNQQRALAIPFSSFVL
jgi:hypothetical protein